MISVEEAIEEIRSNVQNTDLEEIDLIDSYGRVLGKEFFAAVSHPPQNVSSMDGYACNISDIKDAHTTLKVIGEIKPGEKFHGKINKGETARIFTGGTVPDGANIIVIQENVSVKENYILINNYDLNNTFIRNKGLDFFRGDAVNKVGKQINSCDIGLAAAMNVTKLMVRKKPKISIISTGDELVELGTKANSHQIISSTSLSLSMLAKKYGAKTFDLGIAKDNETSINNLIDKTSGSDLIVTIGGASVGDHDLVKSTLAKKGLKIHFWKIAMRPGKPLMFGSLNGVPIISLPGNPVSSIVCSIIFLSHAIHSMMARTDQCIEKKIGYLSRELKQNDSRQDYLRSQITKCEEGKTLIAPFIKQDSSMISTLAKADCLAIRPPNATAAKIGEQIEFIPIAI